MTSAPNQEPNLRAACLDFLFPPLCAGCGQYSDSDTGFCEQCRVCLDTYETPFCLTCLSPLASWPDCPNCREKTLPLFALGNYADPLKQAIADFKFRNVRTPIPWLVRQLTTSFEVKLDACQADLLVPVPLHPSREYDRGYNQAAVLADLLSELLQLPVAGNLIIRDKKRKPQQQLKAFAREANIADVFQALETETPKSRLILVDDVVTSGHTVREVARILNNAGHKVVGVIAIAHGI